MDIRKFFKGSGSSAAAAPSSSPLPLPSPAKKARVAAPPPSSSSSSSSPKSSASSSEEEEEEMDAAPKRARVDLAVAPLHESPPPAAAARAAAAMDEDDSSDEDDVKPPATTTTSSSSSPTRPSPVSGAASASQINALPSKYDPLKDPLSATWESGQPVPYAQLVEVMERVSQTKKRLEIQEEVSQLFRRVIAKTPDDLLPVVYLCLNKVEPEFKGCEMGVGDSILVKAICEVSGKSKQAVDALYKQEGDLGKVAMECKSQQKTLFAYKPKALTVREVFNQFKELTTITGHKSMEAKVKIINKLLGSCVKEEAKYVIRGIQGKLRIGLAEATVLTALAHAVVLTPPGGGGSIMDLRAHAKDDSLVAMKLDEAVSTVKQAFSECPSYDVMIPALLRHPVEKLLEECHISAGVPLKPMLAKPTKGVGEILNRFEGEKFTCEYKYDGERAQIHRLSDGTFKIFSRNSEDNTTKYPDVIEAMPFALSGVTTSFIVDAEVVAYDRATNKTLPFQRLSTRARKDVVASDVKVQVLVFLFDLLLLNGESCLRKPLRERRDLLRGAFVEVPQRVTFASGKDLSDTEDIMEFFQDAVKDSCEGLMIKTLENNATYEPSRRSLNWLKFKKDYQENLNDSLDLVPIGAYYGRGKRTGVFGAFLLACYDPDSDEFQSITKIGTGFSEEALDTLTTALKAKISESGKPGNVLSEMECDVWFEPAVVWEVKAADLSVSPIHKAAVGLVDSNKGIALRFPRFLRVREDKAVEDATHASQVAQLYRDQAVIGGGGADDDEDDD